MGFWANAWNYPMVVKQVLSDVSFINQELEKLRKNPLLPEAARHVLHHKKVFHRVSQYAWVHGVLNLGIARYLGRKLSENEMKSTLYACASGPFFDDFFDQNQHTPQELLQLIQQKIDLPLKSPSEIAYTYLLTQVYENVTDVPRFYQFFSQVYQAQLDSKQLNNHQLDRTSKNAISQQKGIVSAWVFRSLITEDIHPQELNMLQQLGVVGQFMDDIFDLYDDYHEGLQTLANDYTNDFEPVYRRFIQEVQSLKYEIELLPFPRKQTKCYWRELMLMISGGLLACKTFLKVQKKYRHLDLNIIPRKELIVDMESKKNHVKMLLLALKHA